MTRNLRDIYQLRAYLQAQRIVLLLLIFEYLKLMQMIEATVNSQATTAIRKDLIHLSAAKALSTRNPALETSGLGQILLGNPEISSSQQYIMLPEVTAVFPSITLASWASIFTGKQPGETGILGNEFFARDLYDSATPNNQIIPGMQGLSSGMVTLSDEAFSNSSIGFFMYNLLPAHNYAETVQEKLDMSSPNRLLSSEETTISGAPTVQTIYEWLRDENSLQPYFRNPEACMNGGECRSAVFFNHYARGADWWGTIDLVWWKKIGVDIEWLGEFVREKLKPEKAAKTLDETPTEEALDFLDAYYPKDNSDLGYNKEKRFPALFTVYYGGLDHYAHDVGMDGRTEHYTGYTDYFQRKTDVEISILVDKLKELGEFDNKIFIITSDHGHTAMATDLPLIPDEDGNLYEPDTSCKLNLKDFDKDEKKYPEQANNNLHIWELGELFRVVGKEVGLDYKILAPEEIAKLFKNKSEAELPYGATATIDNANVIAAMNGPIAHIYLKNSNWQDFPDEIELGYLALTLQRTLQENGVNLDENMEVKLRNKFPKLLSSVDKILIRLDGVYHVFKGLDRAGNSITDELTTLAGTAEYVQAEKRIDGMNNLNRSGDIILLFKNFTVDSAENRFTSGVSCKSWHGSLNPSDSYVPLIVAYPGGNEYELEPIINVDGVCPDGHCEGNWILTELIKEIIVETQYSGR